MAVAEQVMLGDVIRFGNGKSIKPGGTGPYPVYGSNGIIGGSDEFRHENGVVIGRVGAYCGAVVYCPTKFWASDNTLVAYPASGSVDTKFLYYLLADAKLSRYAGGAAQPLVTQTVLKQVEVRVPTLPIQQRIASILSAYDELIENNQRRIKILESMARALYREWFVHFRFPGHESISRVSSPLGDIPQGWKIKALADVCSRITDGSHSSPQSVEGGYPMASVKDMHNWGVNIEGCRRIAGDDYENLVRNDCKPLKNDILIAKDGSYLKHIFVVDEDQDMVVLSSIAMLRTNDVILPNYLCAALQDPLTKARMKGIVSGVAIPRIVLKDFRKFEILVPPNDVQADWARIVDPVLDMCRKLVKRTENLHRTRDLLLPRLLSGQVDVEDIAA